MWWLAGGPKSHSLNFFAALGAKSAIGIQLGFAALAVTDLGSFAGCTGILLLGSFGARIGRKNLARGFERRFDSRQHVVSRAFGM